MQSMALSLPQSDVREDIDLYYGKIDNSRGLQIIKNVDGIADVVEEVNDFTGSILGMNKIGADIYTATQSIVGGTRKYQLFKISYDAVQEKYNSTELYSISGINQFGTALLAVRSIGGVVNVAFQVLELINGNSVNVLYKGTIQNDIFVATYSKQFTNFEFLAGMEFNAAGELILTRNYYPNQTYEEYPVAHVS